MLAAPLVAVSFLSIVPVRLPRTIPPAAFPRAVGLFPLVGAGLGAIVAGADALLRLGLPTELATALDLAALALVTGGLHLDGLADAADGLLGPLERARRLEVMRTGSVGAFGAAAVVLVLLIEFAALERLSDAVRVPALIAAVGLSRFAVSVALAAFPYARPTGSGRAFKTGLTPADALLAAVIASVIAYALLAERGLTLLVVAAAVAFAVGAFARARLGGLTGDVYGAVAELSFAATLVVLVGLLRS